MVHIADDLPILQTPLEQEHPPKSSLSHELAKSLAALGPDKLYVDCTFGAGHASRCLLGETFGLSSAGRLKSFASRGGAVDSEALQIGKDLERGDVRFEIFNRPYRDLNLLVQEPVAGIVIDLGVNESWPEQSRNDGGLDVFQWLQDATVEELAWLLHEYGNLKDPLLAERFAEDIVQLQHIAGKRCLTLSELASLFDDLQQEFAAEHPRLRVSQILRPLRIFCRGEQQDFEKVLSDAFRLLEPLGRCVVITYSPWQAKVMRSFLHSHDLPGKCSLDRLLAVRQCELYPLLAHTDGFAVRRIGKATPIAMQSDGDHGVIPGAAMLHVFEKVPRVTDENMCCEGSQTPHMLSRLIEPPAPSFAGYMPKSASETLSSMNESPKDDPLSEEDKLELQQLQHDMAARKSLLQKDGLSLSELKKDPQIGLWRKRMNFLHGQAACYVEKRQERERNRCHISVQRDGSVEHLMAKGPDGLYVDCTFGRGGHTALILSKISERGRVKAFDVDPLAVQVGKLLEEEDNRFEILHAPFGDLHSAISDPLAGVLLDLGVSSPQLDDPARGFSVKGKKDGPLDLRMNQTVGIPASAWLQTVSASELAWVISKTVYRVEAPIPERIAEIILQNQDEHGPYRNTSDLVKVLDDIEVELQDEYPHLNLAHIVFVAIRVFLNREEEQFLKVLDGIFEKLEFSGRCVIICFNRWEVAAVRRFLREHEEPSYRARAALAPDRLCELYPLLASGKTFAVRRVSQAIAPSVQEIAQNQRAKSSMHVLEKVPFHTDQLPTSATSGGVEAAIARFVKPISSNCRE